MSKLYQQIAEVLARYVSPMHAEVMLRRGLAAARIERDRLVPQHLPQVATSLSGSIRLFVPPSQQSRLKRELMALGRAPVAPQPLSPRRCVLMVREETDIGPARNTARTLATELGMKSFIVTKVVTIVSELARNIATYSVGGRIELEPTIDSDVRLLIRATDAGPGISNLDNVLAGRYRSKTGMGMGILGVKRLGDDFTISTSPAGTTVQVIVAT